MGGGLFSDAEGGEDDAEEVFGVGVADDFAEGFEGEAEVEGDEFWGGVGGEGGEGGGEGGVGAGEAGVVAGVDDDF